MKCVLALIIVFVFIACTYKGIDFTGELAYCEQRGEQLSDTACATVTAAPSAYEDESEK